MRVMLKLSNHTGKIPQVDGSGICDCCNIDCGFPGGVLLLALHLSAALLDFASLRNLVIFKVDHAHLRSRKYVKQGASHTLASIVPWA
jgi:hypothetical protein